MKFTNGFWLKRPGVELFNATDIREMQAEKDKVTLFISPWQVTNRGRSMDVPDFTRGGWKTAKPLGLVDIDLAKMPFDKKA